MQTLNRLLDKAREGCETRSDVALAARMGVSRQSLHDWRKGVKSISDEHLARLLELAAGAPEDAIAVRKEGAKSDHERAMWRSVARRLGAAAAVAVVALFTNFPVMAKSTQVVDSIETVRQECILCKQCYRVWRFVVQALFPRTWPVTLVAL